MKSPQTYVTETAIKEALKPILGDPDPWGYTSPTPWPGMYIKGTNGAEYVADEIASMLGDELQLGEWHQIGTEVTLDVNNGIAVDIAKNWATRRALERRGFNVFAPAPRAGSKVSVEEKPHATEFQLNSTPEQILNSPVEQWSNYDVGVVYREVMRLGETHPDAIKMTKKIQDWYTAPQERQFEVNPFGDDLTDIFADGEISLTDVSVTQDYVTSAYEKQGFSAEEAAMHIAQQVSEGGFGLGAAQFGLTVRESQAIFDTANSIDIRNRGFTGQEMIAAERFRTEYQKTGRKDIAMDKARAGLVAARAYNGPSQDRIASDSPFDPKDISAYIDIFRNQVQTARIDGNAKSGNPSALSRNITVSGVPEGASVSTGTSNHARAQLLNVGKVQLDKTQAKRAEKARKAPPKTPRTVMINVPHQDYLSGQTQQGAARAARRNIDTTGLNVDLLNKAVPKTRPGQYEVTLGGWSPVGTLAALSRATAKRTPSRKASMTTAHQKALDTRYGYRDPNDPNTPQNQRGYRSFGGWMNAMKDAVSTGWYGNPNKNPNKSVIETGVTQTGTSAQGLIDAQENIDKDLARRQKQERQKQQKKPAPTTESDELSTTMTSNTKTDLWGGSANATISGPQALGGVATAPRPSSRSNKRQKVDLLEGKKGAFGQVTGTASEDGNDKGNDGDSGSSGAPDSGAYEGAVSSAANDPNLSNDDFWSGYEAGTAAYDKANSDGKSSSGKVVCTAMNARYGFGEFRNTIWLKYSRDHLNSYHEIGYHTLFLPLVDFAYTGKEGLVRRMTRRMLEHIARHRTKDIWFEMRGHRRDVIGRVERAVLEPLCFIVGWLKSRAQTRRSV